MFYSPLLSDAPSCSAPRILQVPGHPRASPQKGLTSSKSFSSSSGSRFAICSKLRSPLLLKDPLDRAGLHPVKPVNVSRSDLLPGECARPAAFIDSELVGSGLIQDHL